MSNVKKRESCTQKKISAALLRITKFAGSHRVMTYDAHHDAYHDAHHRPFISTKPLKLADTSVVSAPSALWVFGGSVFYNHLHQNSHLLEPVTLSTWPDTVAVLMCAVPNGWFLKKCPKSERAPAYWLISYKPRKKRATVLYPPNDNSSFSIMIIFARSQISRRIMVFHG